jgi:hypothetical protein
VCGVWVVPLIRVEHDPTVGPSLDAASGDPATFISAGSNPCLESGVKVLT